MFETDSPAAWRRWLAFELKHLRTKAGLSQQDVARQLRCTVNKVAYIEKGNRPVRPRDLDEILLPLYSVADDWRPLYLDAARRARQKGWWEEFDEDCVPEWYSRYIGFEQGASELRTFHPQLVTGLLQTPDYARAVEERGSVASSEDDVRQRVEVRLRRQAVLDRSPEPLRLRAVLDESALHRVVGGPEVMRAQLLHLAEMAERPNVTLQVLPFSAGAHAAVETSVLLLRFPWGSDPGLAYNEVNGTEGSARFVEEPGQVEDLGLVFEQVSSLALHPDETLATIKEIGDKYQ